MFDVLICGAGVAGCALAIYLRRRGLRVLLLGRTPTHSRPVGEHLPPHARPLLEELGVWADLMADGHLRCPGIRSVWGSPQVERRDFIFNPYGDGWNLDRARFDGRLVQHARQAGAEVYDPAVLLSLDRTASGWEATVNTAGGSFTRPCRMVVDATGRASALARRLGSRRVVHDRLVGVASWLEGIPASGSHDPTLLLEAVAQGWWYTAPLPGGIQVVVFMGDAPLPVARKDEVQTLWREHLAQTEHVRRRLAGYQFIGETVVRPANSYAMQPMAGEDWLAVGDAAAALDPLSSMGIYRALTSARRAAAAIQRHLYGDSSALANYAEATRRDFEEQLSRLIWSYRQERRWPDQPFWRARHDTSTAGRIEDHAADRDRRGVALVGGAGGVSGGVPGQRPGEPRP